ncbi:MAG TPA: hypothetical protein VF505_10675 [Thermoanaerobaculia bacterium]
MSAAADQANFPTMIIPKGTEIRLNHNGQLSIKTPGNLVIQNSGNYSEIESTNGSIRIEENVSVEAVSVRAGQACFIQGTLTAWKVHAKRITLEDRAKAFIMVQESEHLDLAKTARLVGNFANEKELYLMMGKFTSQLRELPGSVDMGTHAPLAETRPPQIASSTSTDSRTNPTADPDHLRAAQTILEREVARPDLAPADAEAVREVLFGLRERNLPRVQSVFRDAFRELKSPSDGLKKAYDHLDRYFGAVPRTA